MTNLFTTLALAGLLIGGVTLSGNSPVESGPVTPVTFVTGADDSSSGCCNRQMADAYQCPTQTAAMVVDTDDGESLCCKNSVASTEAVSRAGSLCCADETALCCDNEAGECLAGECPFEAAADSGLMTSILSAGGELLTLTSMQTASTDAEPCCGDDVCPDCETVCCDAEGVCKTGCCDAKTEADEPACCVEGVCPDCETVCCTAEGECLTGCCKK